ncbi:MAG: hypothetical protein FJ255_10665 [Phycisphaerae bacterium]|nr:hypothetical protein [Phycisphaerae bacterium]
MRRMIRRVGPIGVQIGARRLIAAQVESRGRRPRLHALARISRGASGGGLPELSDLERLSETMERLGFEGRQVVLVAPAEKELVSVLELPAKSAGAPLGAIAPAEFARERRIDPGSFEMGWWELPEASRAAPGTRAMAVGIAHEDVEGLIELVVRAGFDPVAVDARAVAFGRAVSAAGGSAEGINAVVDIGWGGVGVSLLVGSMVVYHRTVFDAGLVACHREICSRLGVDAEGAEVLLDVVGGGDGESGSGVDPALLSRARSLAAPRLRALARDVSASLSYGSHLYPGQAVGRVYVVGEGARHAAVRDAIAECAESPVEALTPERLVDIVDGGGRGVNDADATLAVSLALWSEGEA